MELKNGSIGLPGKISTPMEMSRDSFSLKTNYSYLRETAFIPSLSQSFYNIGGVETNFLLFNLLFDNATFIFETEMETRVCPK